MMEPAKALSAMVSVLMRTSAERTFLVVSIVTGGLSTFVECLIRISPDYPDFGREMLKYAHPNTTHPYQ